MLNSKRNLSLVAASAALFLLAISAGCTGFFVNPTLTSIAIGPQTPTIIKGQSLQMTATGTYSDGTTKDLTGKAFWNSATPACATVSSSGLVVAPNTVSNICTSVVGASFGTVTAASTTVTVTPGTPTSITLTVSTNTPQANTTVTFTAMALFPGNSTAQDITTSVTWINSDTTDLTLTNGSGTGTISATAASGTQINVQASFGGVNSNIQTLTVQ